MNSKHMNSRLCLK